MKVIPFFVIILRITNIKQNNVMYEYKNDFIELCEYNSDCDPPKVCCSVPFTNLMYCCKPKGLIPKLVPIRTKTRDYPS